MLLQWVKKYYICLGLVLLLLCVLGYSQVHAAFGEKMKFVEFTFCEDDIKNAKQVDLVLEEGEEHEFCYNVGNTSQEDMEIEFFYVDGGVRGTKFICESTKFTESFAQYVTGYSEKVLIPAGGSVQETATLAYPAGIAGQFGGCITYNVANEGGGQFTMRVGRSRRFKVEVKGTIKVGLEVVPHGASDDLGADSKLYVQPNGKSQVVIKLKLENTGNILQTAEVKALVADILGNEVGLGPKKVSIAAGGTEEASFTYDIPRYQGKFDVTASLTHKPVFLFDGEAITDDMRSEKTADFATGFMVIPRWLLSILIVPFVLWRTVKIFRRKKKKKGGQPGQFPGQMPPGGGMGPGMPPQGMPPQPGYGQQMPGYPGSFLQQRPPMPPAPGMMPQGMPPQYPGQQMQRPPMPPAPGMMPQGMPPQYPGQQMQRPPMPPAPGMQQQPFAGQQMQRPPMPPQGMPPQPGYPQR